MKESEAIERMKYRIDTATDISGKGVDVKTYEDMEIAIKALEKIQEYRAIGTPDHFREIAEKDKPTTPEISNHFYICPRCGTRKNIMMKSPYCSECGQAFGWEEL